MTPEELAAIRERAEKVGGPWESFGTGVNTVWSGAQDWSGPIDDRTPVVLDCDPNVSEFIAHAPTDIATLLAEVERLQASVVWNLGRADKLNAHLDKVRALHTPEAETFWDGVLNKEYTVTFCTYCSAGMHDCDEPIIHPCPTIQAIDGSDQ